MTIHVFQRISGGAILLVIILLAGFSTAGAAEENGIEGALQPIGTPSSRSVASQRTEAPVVPSLPLLLAEGSNSSCEIVSCGMGIKQTCQITCPAGKTPKCSCDCERNIGPLCMDYKANCRCD